MQYSLEGRPKFFFIASTFLIVAALFLAREVLVPLALSMLLSFVLGPLVTRIERTGLRRAPSVLLVALLSFTLIGGSGYIFTQQLAELAHDLPRYSDNLRQKIKSLKPSRKSVITELQETVQKINKEITAPVQPQPAAPSAAARFETARAENAKAEIARTESTKAELAARAQLPETGALKSNETPLGGFDFIAAALSPILAPLATAGIVAICVIFMLIHREDLRDRVIRLIGEGRITVTTEALDEAAVRVSRYLSALLVVNVSFGIAVSIGLYLIGVPNAFLFGFLAVILRFVPYIGATIAASIPILLSLASTPGWSQPVSVLALFVVLELIIANFVEPLVFSRGTGLSPIAVLASALFWTWIWGAIGLLLATPITVCLVVTGKYVPALEFLSILFGDRPALQPHVRLYQRLLASDQEEALDITREWLKLQPLENIYEEILLPVLALAERDRLRGRVDHEKEQAIRAALKDISSELEVQHERSKDGQARPATENPVPVSDTELSSAPDRMPKRVVIVPARSEVDKLSATFLAQLLRHHGIASEIGADGAALPESDDGLKNTIIVISAMSPPTLGNARAAVRRMRGRDRLGGLIVGFWNEAPAWERAKERLSLGDDVGVVTSLSAALEKCSQLLGTPLRARATADEDHTGIGVPRYNLQMKDKLLDGQVRSVR